MGCSPADCTMSLLPYQYEIVVDFQVYVMCFVINVFLSCFPKAKI